MDQLTTAAALASMLETIEVDEVLMQSAHWRASLPGTDAERDHVLTVAGRLRSELARLRRREHELNALFSSARELAEVRDVDMVLTRLVTRAHEMMGTDVTYLSQFDPATRELHVRKTAGAVTPVFQNLRVPPGKGLASGIAASRTAQWALRYSDYAGDPHEAGIDDAVSSEGIVSILGVPMLAEGEVLGVLFAATRHEHAFTAEETALLSALADHASVVLQTASIVDQLRSSEEESRRALATLTDHLRSRDRSNAVHQQLVQAVLRGGGFEQVAATLAEALGRRVTVVDGAGREIAASGPTESDSVALIDRSGGIGDAIDTSRATGHCCYVFDGESAVEVVAALPAGASDAGALLLSRGAIELDSVDERTIERAAQVGALLTLQESAADDADRRVRGELVADVLDATPQRRRDLDRRVRNHGLSLGDLDTVVIAVVPAETRTAASRVLASRLAGGALVAERAGVLVAITHAVSPLDVAETVRNHLREQLPGTRVLAVAPPSAESSDELPERFETALRTSRLAEALGHDDRVALTDAYQPYSILFEHDPHALHSFIDTTIGAVIRYDSEHDTDLVRTLVAFIRHDASPTKTARALNYHPNTILQRLDRLKSLLGPDWRTDEELFRISTAVRLDELRAHSFR